LPALRAEAERLGKPSWRPMLAYTAALHAASIHPPCPPFPYPWEEIGPGYCYGPAFGHWDIVHAILDVLPAEPEHARLQLLNNLAAQQEDGLVPGSIWMREDTPRWSTTSGHPPVWPLAAQDHADLTGSPALLAQCYQPLLRQIGWFETQRRAEPQGFFYTDILTRRWESGVDEGIRFYDVQSGPYACIDATAHVFALCDYAARWAETLGEDGQAYRAKAEALRRFIQEELWVSDVGFFYDIWAVRDPSKRHTSYEGMWPLVVGAATLEQAMRLIDEHLLNPARFGAAHPITSVGMDDPLFELRCWRGPTWNSMTYWAARGCLRYGRADAARQLVERALDHSAAQFARTGTIWEFYHPHGGRPEEVQRKPHTPYNAPCRDYLGHNPLFALARLWEATGSIGGYG
jgi:glycogen debranching enzyme